MKPLLTGKQADDLEAHIQKWVDGACEDMDIWWSENIVHIMAKAAITALESAADLTAYFKKEGMLES